MRRSKLKNIINKSKELSKPTSAFDKFKNSLPEEVPVGYRLQAAWEAYGKPSNYKEAVWLGLILPIDENTIKWPSIGYNTETEEYEYLNEGRENDTIAKDIRVWDNDVIPFVLELKRGGYVRAFNEEKNCWTYSKNPLAETFDPEEEVIESFKTGGKKKIKIKTIWDDYIEVDSISDDQKAGRVPIGKRNGQDLYLGGDGIAAPLNHAPGKQENGGIIDSFKQGGQMNLIPEGALHARKNNLEGAGEDFTAKGIPVMTTDGKELVAEIEHSEIILNKELTDFVEENYKKFKSDETSEKEKDELAIKVGKKLVKDILTNTDDRTNLIETVLELM